MKGSRGLDLEHRMVQALYGSYVQEDLESGVLQAAAPGSAAPSPLPSPAAPLPGLDTHDPGLPSLPVRNSVNVLVPAKPTQQLALLAGARLQQEP